MRRLEHSANHDFLTGVLARSAMTRKAGELLEHKHRSKEAVSLLLIDIDHFKQINDTHGHSAGDQVLASFAHIVRRELRHDQLFGRLGGEEFAIMLPRALAAQGVALGEHLRRLVEQTELQAEGKQTLKITISVGVASLAMNEVKSLEQLMNMADIALYRAKSQGRNRVESFNVVNGNSVEHILFR
jgi:diguanylate cyclase (GGDEF)-like protein